MNSELIAKNCRDLYDLQKWKVTTNRDVDSKRYFELCGKLAEQLSIELNPAFFVDNSSGLARFEKVPGNGYKFTTLGTSVHLPFKLKTITLTYNLSEDGRLIGTERTEKN